VSDFDLVGHNDDGEDFDAGHSPADPEQVARHLHEERRYLGSGDPPFDELPEAVRTFAVALIVALLEWIHREGSEA
jgi:hypothetical protein